MTEDRTIYKTCVLCRQKLPRGCFNKHNHFKDGFFNRCKRCARLKAKTSGYLDKEFAKAQKMRYGHARI
jgi:hypothetical protein